jgi:glutathione peroxidase
MKYVLLLLLLTGGDMLGANTVHDFEVTTITGDTLTLDAYRGKVILIVNTASKCGYTPQYKGLEELYKTYGPQGLVILGFPANNFMKQEPGTNEEIAAFCQLNYGVSFPMFAKISVRGKDIHPLYAYLTNKKAHDFGGAIKWNFTKFLINRQGEIINRFAPGDTPQGKKMLRAIEEAL